MGNISLTWRYLTKYHNIQYVYGTFSKVSTQRQCYDKATATLKRWWWTYQQLDILYQPIANDRLILQRNGTLNEVSTIHTGHSGMENFGYMDRLNGLDHLPYWNDKPCTEIRCDLLFIWFFSINFNAHNKYNI